MILIAYFNNYVPNYSVYKEPSPILIISNKVWCIYYVVLDHVQQV
jgi:hypothetical protein